LLSKPQRHHLLLQLLHPFLRFSHSPLLFHTLPPCHLQLRLQQCCRLSLFKLIHFAHTLHLFLSTLCFHRHKTRTLVHFVSFTFAQLFLFDDLCSQLALSSSQRQHVVLKGLNVFLRTLCLHGRSFHNSLQ